MTFERDARRRPLCFRHPPTGAMFLRRLWRDALLHPDTQHRLRHNPRVDTLQPLIPPAQRLLQESDGRTGHAVVRIEMCPRTDQAFAGTLERGQQRGNRVVVGIGPTAYGIDWAGDSAVVFTHGSMFPVIIPLAMFEPHL